MLDPQRLEVSLTISNPKSTSRDIFYKDMGGKHSLMEVIVQGPPHTPLKAELLYEGGEVLEDQDILVLLSEKLDPSPRGTRIQTDATGCAFLRFRITEVSKNHRNQRFLIRVSAGGPLYAAALAPAFTRAIEVRTKIRAARRAPVASVGSFLQPPSRSPSPSETHSSGDESAEESAVQAMASLAEQTLARLVKRSAEVLSRLEWQAGPTTADGHTRVRFCPWCGVCTSAGLHGGGDAVHAPSCALGSLLSDCRRVGGGWDDGACGPNKRYRCSDAGIMG